MRTLQEIKTLRKRYNLNQKELAGKAGVSQSLIAKIEAGSVEPTYGKAQRIFEALEELQQQHELKAKDIMHKRVFFADINELVRKVIDIMKQKNISQVPVLHQGKVCGIITENTILNKVVEQNLLSRTAGDIMEETPPIVALSTGFSSITELLRVYPVILVSEQGDIKGIISKADVLGRIS